MLHCQSKIIGGDGNQGGGEKHGPPGERDWTWASDDVKQQSAARAQRRQHRRLRQEPEDDDQEA